MKPRFIVEQKITAFVNQYRIFAVDEAGGKTDLIGFAQQKRIALKEKIEIYTDEQKQSLNFTFRAEKVLDVHGKYLVEDASGQLIGSFRKEFAKSLLNSTWQVLDLQEQPIVTVKESNMALAILRRFGGFIPIVGDIIELITQFLRFHFVFVAPDNETEVRGTYQKTTLFRDHYQFSMTDEAYSQADWRVYAAMGIALDALQSR